MYLSVRFMIYITRNSNERKRGHEFESKVCRKEVGGRKWKGKSDDYSIISKNKKYIKKKM